MSDVFPFNLPDKELRRYAKALKAEKHLQMKTMSKLPEASIVDQVARSGGKLLEVWRSREFLCQVYREGDHLRLSICRCEIDVTNRRWRDGISWEELMRVKHEVGRGGFDAAEAYPKDRDVVNVANLRHLFVFQNDLPWLWRKKG